jgi:hypothetical protein
VWFLAAAALVDAAGVLTGFFQYSLLGRIAEGLPVTDAELESNDITYGLVGLLQLLLVLATAVPFLMWFHRAHKNLPALGAADLKYSPRWAVGGWFVPFLNLVRPHQVAQEIWQWSDPARSNPQEFQQTPAGKSRLITAWWSVFLLSNFVSNMGGRLMLREEADVLQTATVILVFADALSLVAAILAILVIRRIEEGQSRVSQSKQLGQTIQPPAPIDLQKL